MSGVVFTQRLEGLASLVKQINALVEADLQALLEDIGDLVESQTRRRLFDEKQSPEGDAWAPLSEEWAVRKARRSSGGLLEYEGHLRDSIGFDVDGDEVAIGSGSLYAAIHQFGGEPVGKPGLVERPFLGISDDNEREIEELVSEWLDSLKH